MISSGGSDVNQSREDEPPVDSSPSPLGFPEDDLGEIIAPEDEKVTEVESDHMCDETLITVVRKRHLYDK